MASYIDHKSRLPHVMPEIDAPRCREATVLLTAALYVALGFAFTQGVKWSATMYVPLELGVESSNSTNGVAQVTKWTVAPHIVWPITFVLCAYETYVLQRRSNLLGDEDSGSYTYETMGESPGSIVAHTEFWAFLGVHHYVLGAFLLSPCSFNFLTLFTLLYTLAFAAFCEPNKDNGLRDARDEIVTNRVILIGGAFAATLIVAMLNPQPMSALARGTDGANSVFAAQLFFDFALILAHANTGAKFGRILRARLIYTLVTGGTALVWIRNHE
jgi:hypothetical protein